MRSMVKGLEKGSGNMATTKSKQQEIIAALQVFAEAVRENPRIDLGLRRAAERLIAKLEEVQDE